MNFPTNPTIGDNHPTVDPRWMWDGSVWQRLQRTEPQPFQGTGYHLQSIASTNANTIKSSAGSLYEITAYSDSATDVFVCIFNKSSPPDIMVDKPVVVIKLGSATDFFKAEAFGAIGKRLNLGIAITVTAADFFSPLTTEKVTVHCTFA